VTLHFLRHAKTNQNSATGRDFDRELLPRGYEQIIELQAKIATKPISISHVFCSSAQRTRQTLSQIATFFPDATISFHDELYLASKSELLNFLTEKKNSEEILVIGHNEGLSDLVSYLTDTDIHLKTCGYIQVSFPFDHSGYLSSGTGSVVETFRVN
jgi:phosphohistidine phosphatase